jgi:hypothetical protein
LTVVLPKFNVALELVAEMPAPVGFVMVVVPIDRLPDALARLMPVVLLLEDVTLVNVIPIVVGLTSSAGPPVAAIEPAATFTVPLLVADTPVPFEVVTVSDENESVPLFDARFTPVPADDPLFTVVLPKLRPPIAIPQF